MRFQQHSYCQNSDGKASWTPRVDKPRYQSCLLTSILPARYWLTSGAAKMLSHPRSRKSSRSSAKRSFKTASILENGGQPPLQDELTTTETKLVPDYQSETRRLPILPQSGSLPVRGDVPCHPTSGTDSDATRSPIVVNNPEDLRTTGVETAGTRIDSTAYGRREYIPHKRFGLHTDQLHGPGQHGQGGCKSLSCISISLCLMECDIKRLRTTNRNMQRIRSTRKQRPMHVSGMFTMTRVKFSITTW